MITPNIRLKTDTGRAFYQDTAMVYQIAQKTKELPDLKSDLLKELHLCERELSFFLYDEGVSKMHKMDKHDDEGWNMYNSLNDVYYTLKYFLEKK
jgi:hypothetical protein